MSERSLILRDNRGELGDRYILVIKERHCSYFYSFGEHSQAHYNNGTFCGSSQDGLYDGNHWGTVITPTEAPRSILDAMFKCYCDHRNSMIKELKTKILLFEQKPKSEYSKSEADEYDEMVQSLHEILAG